MNSSILQILLDCKLIVKAARVFTATFPIFSLCLFQFLFILSRAFRALRKYKDAIRVFSLACLIHKLGRRDCFRRFISILLSKRLCFQFPGRFYALWTMRLIHRINASALFLPHGRALVICSKKRPYESFQSRPKSSGDSRSVRIQRIRN